MQDVRKVSVLSRCPIKGTSMTEAAIIATKLFMYAAMMGALGEPEVGVGAYYAEGLMEQVCARRVKENWTSGLQCDWYCLVSAIEPEDIGQWWAVEVGGSIHLCLTVDVGAEQDLETLRQRGEIVELPYWLAMKANWTGYVEGVRVWRLQGGLATEFD